MNEKPTKMTNLPMRRRKLFLLKSGFLHICHKRVQSYLTILFNIQTRRSCELAPRIFPNFFEPCNTHAISYTDFHVSKLASAPSTRLNHLSTTPKNLSLRMTRTKKVDTSDFQQKLKETHAGDPRIEQIFQSPRRK